MAVRERDKRNQLLEQLQAKLELWDKHLRDQDWIERLLDNGDWKQLTELYIEEGKFECQELKELKHQLCTKPMVPDQVIALREAVMLMEQTQLNREAFVKFPQLEVLRLNEIRKEYPVIKAQIEELKKREGEVLAHA